MAARRTASCFAGQTDQWLERAATSDGNLRQARSCGDRDIHRNSMLPQFGDQPKSYAVGRVSPRIGLVLFEESFETSRLLHPWKRLGEAKSEFLCPWLLDS
jgi:hypothetical protein